MASVEEQLAALTKRIETLEKRDRTRRKQLDRAHARIDFLTKLINHTFPWQNTAPTIRLREVADEDIPYVCEYLASARVYQRIDASYCELSLNSIDAIADMLKEGKHFEEIDLTRNPLGDNAAKSIAAILTNGANLRLLNLHSIGLTDAGFAVVANALRGHPSLTSLTLSANQLTAESMKLVGGILSAPDCRIRTLNLSRNALGADGLRALATAITNNRSLQKLILQEVNAGDEGAKVIADMVGQLQLTYLGIATNKIGVNGAKAIFEALKGKSAVKTILAFGNAFGDGGAQALAQLIRNNTTLQELDVRHCQIGVEGGKAIADALLTNQTLQSLGIDGNELGSSQAAIAASYKGRFARSDDEDGGKPNPFGKQGSIMRIFYRKSRDDEDEDERKATLPRTKSTSD